MKIYHKKNIEDILALTPMQEGLLFHYMQDPGSLRYFEQLTLEISGVIDRDIFAAAWNAVIEANEMLRTAFRWEKVENPVQVILKEHSINPVYADYSSLQPREPRELVNALKTRDRNTKFDLHQVPFRVTLVKTEENHYFIIISNHHILYDGWSNRILLREFFNAYEALANGEKPAGPQKAKFKEFLQWAHEQSEQEKKGQKEYWQDHLEGIEAGTQFPVKKGRTNGWKSIEGSEGASYRTVISKPLSRGLEEFGKENKITIAALLYGAWGILLRRYTGNDDVLFGTTVSGRSAKIKGIAEMVGMFINTLPLRVKILPGEKTLPLLRRTHETLQKREPYEHTPLVKTRGYSRVNPAEELFDSIVVIENYPLDPTLNQGNANLKVTSYSSFTMTNYDLTAAIFLGEEIEICILYPGELFEEGVIERLARHYTTILKEITANPGTAIDEIDMLSPEEKRQLLEEFNDSGADYPRDKTIHGLFEEQVEQTPDYVALTGPKLQITKYKLQTNSKSQIPNHKQSGALRADVDAFGENQLSYGILNEESNRLAWTLQEKGVQPGTIVALMEERSLEMIIGILGILKSGAAYLPLNPDQPGARTHFMMQDSGAKVLLSETGKFNCQLSIANSQLSTSANKNPKGTAFLTSTLTLTCQVGPANLAYIIYTSGSTGNPKGVPITHANLSPLLHWGYERLGIGEKDRVMQNLSYYFDWSVWEIFTALTTGASLYMVPGELVSDAERYLDLIYRQAITVLHITPTHFQTLISVRVGQRLSTLRHLCIGAEKLTADLVERSYGLVDERCRVYNMYGPTEATIMAAVLETDKTKLPFYSGLSSVPIGKNLGNNVLLVLDRYRHPSPMEVPGELYIGGEGVARGYLNNPELTAEKFIVPSATRNPFEKGFLDFPKLLFNSPSPFTTHHSPLTTHHSPIYRTGDLARWHSDGSIEFLGRMDQQVKIRGYRIEPGEIEKQLLQHPEVNEALVMARENKQGETELCAYVVLQAHRSPGKSRGEPCVHPVFPDSPLRDYLSARLPVYMVPAHFMELERMPLNPNGKVDTRALPEPGILPGRETTGPRDRVEEKLAELWGRVLGIDKTRLGIDDNFFALGGHSLTITRLAGLVAKELNAEIPFREFFQNPTIREQAQYTRGQEKHRSSEILPVEEKEYYPLSPAQKRLFILRQMEAGSIVYHIRGVILLEGTVEKEKFQEVFRQLIRRHESFRTSFMMVRREPVQQIHAQVEFEIENSSVAGGQARAAEAADTADTGGTGDPGREELHRFFNRPFDISRAPLLRVGLIKLQEDRYLWAVDMHHIISDGASVGVLVGEFMALYEGKNEGKNWPVPKIRCRDFAEWANSQSRSQEIKAREEYWLNRFRGEIPVLNLPMDFTRPAVQGFAGAHMKFEISREDTAALKALALEEKVTLYGVLLAIINILLARMSSQEDIIIGTPVMGRRQAGLSQLIGMFVNTLALRNFPTGGKTVRAFVKEVGAKAAEAFENQEYPFEDLVEKTIKNRDTGRNPLFDVMFAMQSMEIPRIRVPGMHLEPYPYDDGIARFDLVFICEKADEKLQFTVEYSTGIFRDDTIKKIINYFQKVAAYAIHDGEAGIGEIEIITDREKREILFEFNDREAGYPLEKTIQELFKEQVERTPDYVALTGPKLQITKYKLQTNSKSQIPNHKQSGALRANFLDAFGAIQLSYGILNDESDRLAWTLLERGVQPGMIVGIMIERSIEMIIGITGILKSGAAYLPLNPDQPGSRTHFMMQDSGAKVLLSETGKFNCQLSIVNSQLSTSANKSPKGTASLTSTLTCQVGPANLAYIIYTSGSTGNPKGVPITHANFSQLVHWGYRHLGIGPGERVIQNLSYFFDWSVWEIFIALTTGAGLFMITGEMAANPGQEVEFIAANVTTVLHCTPTQYRYLLQTGGKMPTLKYLFLGAEELSVDLVERGIEAVGEHCRIFNMYGPTEATIISAVLEIPRPRVREYKELSGVPIGKPVGNTRLLVLDSYLKLCPVKVAGELYIAGDGLAAGYLNNPELTFERFIKSFCGGSRGAVFSKRVPLAVGDKLYKTGDLARWQPEGTVEFLGRIDSQVKIRGYRIEPGEIEKRLLAYGSVREAIVIDRETEKGEKYLCAYIMTGRREEGAGSGGVSIEDMREFLAQALPAYMIPAHFILIDRVPLNPNGKVDRKALPQPVSVPGITAAAGEYAAPMDALEMKLVEIWAEVLGRDGDIGIDENFFALGGHSLKASVVISQVSKTLNVRLPLVEFFKRPTIGALAQYIRQAKKSSYFSLELAEEKEYYLLAPAQKRLYILQQQKKDDMTYNMYQVMVMEGGIEKERLERVICRLIGKHESFRTSFHMVKGEPVQRIYDYRGALFEKTAPLDPPQKLFIETPLTLNTNTNISNFLRPFDLSQAPLLRVGLLELEEKKHLLIVDMHHIVSDGVSVGILIKDFMALYGGQEISSPGIRYTYKDFSEWQNSAKGKNAIHRHEGYWQGQFRGEIPGMEMPYDFPGGQGRRTGGDTFKFEMGKEETWAIKQLAHEERVTLFMVLMAGYSVLLSKLSGSEDIVVGTAAAGREQAELRQIIGMFVNTLAIRSCPAAGKPFRGFLQEIKQITLNAFEHQLYPFDRLVEKVAAAGDIVHPLFSTMFSMQNQEVPGIEIPGLILKPYDYTPPVSRFDMTWIGEAVEQEKILRFTIEYSTALFAGETVKRFTGYYRNILSSVLKAGGLSSKIAGIDILPEAEKERILYEFNETVEEYPKDYTIHRLFEEQVERAPDRVALVGNPILPVGPVQLTYCELNVKSGRLAQGLMERGIGPDSIVPIMVERSLEMIVGLLGILKAGGAYLPLDPDYPQERIDYMLKDSGAVEVLTAPAVKDALNRSNGSHKSYILPGNLAYIIYTSGSTGRPKGVAVQHSSVVNLVQSQVKHFKIDEDDRVLQFSSLSFDASVEQIFIALSRGAALVLIHKNTLLHSEAFAAFIRRHKITHIHAVPSFLSSIPQEEYPHLKRVISGGDTCPVTLARQWSANCDFIDEYGPTETTVTSIQLAVKEVEDTWTRLPIGKPIANTFVYLVDKAMNLVPIGVVGELFIGGAGVARGYLNRPELTAEKFIMPSVTRGSFEKPLSAPRAAGLDPVKLLFNYLSPFTFHHSPLYKTGDLARWQSQGNIEFLGREDRQVKIRGFRIELGEIESQLLTHEEIKEAAAVIREDKPGTPPYVCVYFVTKNRDKVTGDRLRDYLAGRLPGYMIPAYFVPLEAIPLTPVGKPDRKALPDPGEVERETGYTAPHGEIEIKLAGIWKEVLGIEAHTVGIEDNFFERGGHSLKVTNLVRCVYRGFNVDLEIEDVFKNPTLGELSKVIGRKLSVFETPGTAPTSSLKYSIIPPAASRRYYPLSAAQQRLYVLQQVKAGHTGYNISFAAWLEGGLDREKLEEVFAALIRRHESFRTSIQTLQGQPYQEVHDEVDFQLENYKLQNTNYKQIPNSKSQITNQVDGQVLNASGDDVSLTLTLTLTLTQNTNAIIKEFIRPFDLTRAPLLRIGLVGIDVKTHLLMVDMHHIISDGTSSGILIKEFMALYAGETLTPLPIQYKDYASWEETFIKSRELGDQETYWLRELEGVPVTNLPLDFPRPADQQFKGSRVSFTIAAGEVEELTKLALRTGASLYMVILSIFTVLLSKWSDQQDIVIGTPVANRRHSNLQGVVGMFVNTLALRNFPDPGKPFNYFLNEVKERTLKAYENQEYPFDRLVEKILGKKNRDAARNPLFDVMLVFQNMEIPGIQMPGLKLTPYPIETETSPFDLMLIGAQTGQELDMQFYYNPAIFKPGTLDRLVGWFKEILRGVVENVRSNREMLISEMNMITETERRQLLEEFNGAAVEYPRDRTIVDLLEAQEAKTPGQVALVGSKAEAKKRRREAEKQEEVPFGQINAFGGKAVPHDGADHFAGPVRPVRPVRPITLTYREFNSRVNRLAHFLRSRGVKRETMAAVLMGRTLDLVVSIAAILKAGAAYLPLEVDNPQKRIRGILEESSVSFLLTERDLMASPAETHASGVYYPDLLQEELKPYPGTNPIKTNKPGDLLYVISTSGSTGRPKGVMMEHRCLVNLLHYQWTGTAIDFSRVLQFASIAFDVSFQEIFSTLAKGGTLFLIGNEIRSDISFLLDFILKNSITTLFLPPAFLKFIFNEGALAARFPVCVRHIVTAGEQLVVTEPMRKYLIGNRVYLHNHYGPAESHAVTGFTMAPGDEIPNQPPIGKPINNTSIFILDSSGNLQPVGVVGEIYIGGEAVGRGYLNNPGLTAEKFIMPSATKNPFEKGFLDFPKLLSNSPSPFTTHHSPLTTHHSPIYKTGDLAQWQEDGNIRFLGRRDHQVKIRGYRVELGEIENRLLTIANIKAAVVLNRRDEAGEPYLCAYVVLFDPRSELAGEELRENLSNHLPAYMVPSYYIQVPEIPLNTSGKVDRSALPGPAVGKSTAGYTAPGDALEKKLVEIWAGVLGIEEKRIGIDENFFEMGGHSLKGTVLISRIHQEFDAALSLADLFGNPTVRRLARDLRGKTGSEAMDRFMAIEPAGKQDYYELSPAQKRLYILQQMDPAGTTYNMPMIMGLTGAVSIRKIETIFKTLVARHESFRTSFEPRGKQTVQEIHTEVVFEIENHEISKVEDATKVFGSPEPFFQKGFWPPEAIIKDFIRPFDLSKAPLLRVGVVKAAGEEYLLMVDMHHIISDGVTLEIVLKEFTALYRGETLPPLRLQYKDYSGWQNRLLRSGQWEQQAEYWQNRLKGSLPELNMPLDFPRGNTRGSEGDTRSERIDENLLPRIRESLSRTGTTLYQYLLAVFNVLLEKYTGQEDIIVGSPVSGRQHAELEGIAGVFVNMVAMRNYPEPRKTFAQFLEEVKNNALAAYQNQDYPFDELVNRLGLQRKPGRNPVFDIGFLYNVLETPKTRDADLQITPYEIPNRVSRFDMLMGVWEHRGRITIGMEYSTRLYKPAGIDKMLRHYREILRQVTENPDLRLEEIKIDTGLKAIATPKPAIQFGFG